jgi:hypothetical protein
MKTWIVLTLVALIAAPILIQPAAADPLVRHRSSQSERTSDQRYDSREDLTQIGPFHRGPIYHGFPLSDWYVY